MTAGPPDAAAGDAEALTAAEAAEARTVAAGRAAGYCWARVPGDRGRCTWPPGHGEDVPHRDAYHPSERARWPYT